MSAIESCLLQADSAVRNDVKPAVALFSELQAVIVSKPTDPGMRMRSTCQQAIVHVQLTSCSGVVHVQLQITVHVFPNLCPMACSCLQYAGMQPIVVTYMEVDELTNVCSNFSRHT